MQPQELTFPGKLFSGFCERQDYTSDDLLCVSREREFTLVPVFNGAVCITIRARAIGPHVLFRDERLFSISSYSRRQLIWCEIGRAHRTENILERHRYGRCSIMVQTGIMDNDRMHSMSFKQRPSPMHGTLLKLYCLMLFFRAAVGNNFVRMITYPVTVPALFRTI